MNRIILAAAATVFATSAFAMQPAQPVGDYSANVEKQFEYNTEDMGQFSFGSNVDTMTTASTGDSMSQGVNNMQPAPGNEENITDLKSGR